MRPSRRLDQGPKGRAERPSLHTKLLIVGRRSLDYAALRAAPLETTGCRLQNYTPAAPQSIARVTAITHRNGAVFQAPLTGIGGEGRPTENHILKQLS